MKEDKIKFSFSYKINGEKHMFKEEIENNKRYINLFDLIREFKKFAVACGFSSSMVNRITYKDIPEYEEDSIII